MTVIEQRILVEAPVEATWPYVADPTLITKWNRACKQIAVLSTQPTGLRARRRCIGDNGRTVVEEITAWLEHIGYEYVVVDGPYQSYRGRFRLQAIPEGTIVNWAVEYRLKGPMSGLRNVTSFRRWHEDLMTDSLRTLRRAVEASGVHFDPSQHAKYAMQSGPGAEARASRTVSLGEDDLPDLSSMPSSAPASFESPGVGNLAGRMGMAEPGGIEFVNEATGPANAVQAPDDTKPRPPKGLQEAIAAQNAAEPPVPSRYKANGDDNQLSELDRIRQSVGQTVPISMVAPPREADPETQTMEILPPKAQSQPPKAAKRLFSSPAPDTLPEVSSTPPTPLAEPRTGRGGTSGPMPSVSASNVPPVDAHDTSEISIWDVFGVQRPSERSQTELEAVIASLQPETDSPDAPAASDSAINEPSMQHAAEGDETPDTDQDTGPAKAVRPHLAATRNRKSSPPVRGIARRGRLKADVNVRRAKPM
ncbi:MAG TPA: SRPBCC family protein [Aggregatilineales bacterium]|nr:SRPBCC family protein [Aggregatilineales bacterium]